MMEFFSADHHFGHGGIIKYTERPFSSIEEMENEFVYKWNSVVNDGDTVYHLGDFFFCNVEKALEILKRLKGNVYLIPGNHDGTARSIRYKFLNKDEITLNKRTTMVKEIVIEKQRIILCHYPFHEWNGSHRGSFHLHGHSHGRTSLKPGRLDIGVDCWDYAPVSYEAVKKVILTDLEKTKLEKSKYG